MRSAGLSACSSPPADVPAERAGATGRFVVFRESELVIKSLENPVSPPVTVGSARRGDLLSSNAPDVVTVDPSGNLVAHRNGSAVVRSVNGSMLAVQVRAGLRLRIEPASVYLEPEGKTAVTVLLDGQTLTPGAVSWEMSDPEIAFVHANEIRAGARPGSTRIAAVYEGARAEASVRVAGGREKFTVTPSRRILRVGTVEEVQVDMPRTAILGWTSSDENVLMPLRAGLFYGHAPGRATACAMVSTRKSCTTITVQR